MRWLWNLAVDIPQGSPSLKSWFLWREENQGTRRKICVARTKTNQQQTQPTRDTRSGKQTWATTLGVEHSHHCTIPAPFELIVYVATAIKFVLQILTSAFMESMTVSTNRQTVLIRLDRTTVFVKMVTKATEKPFARQRVSSLTA